MKASLNAAGVQPGRFVHGPLEKQGLPGRTPGLVRSVTVFLPSLQMGRNPLGGRGPQPL